MERLDSHNTRKDLIFESISQLVIEEGLASVTYAKISSRCHLHINTIAYYFDGKDDIMVQCLRHTIEADRSRLPEYYFRVPDGIPPAEALCKLIDHIIDFGYLKSPLRRALNQYLLSNTTASPLIRKCWDEIDRKNISFEYDAIMTYKDTGILCETNVPLAS